MLWSAAIVLAALCAWTSLSATASPIAAAPAPAWKLQDVNGKTISSADFKGKVVVLDFWATWCPPCRAEIPGFVELQKQYGKDGVVVIGASVESSDEIVAVRKFAEKFGINYPVGVADQDSVRAFGGVDAIPTTFIIDREGRIVSRHLGFTEKADLEKEIKPLLRDGNRAF
jgi:peroxiredoxin